MKPFNLVRRPIGKFLCLLLVTTMATGPVVRTHAQEPAAQPSGEIPLELPRNIELKVELPPQNEAIRGDTTLLADPSAGKIDLSFVTPQAVALVALRPQQLLTAPQTAKFPIEVASAIGLQQLNIDPAGVVEAVLFLEPPSVMGLPYGAVIKFAKPFSLGDLPEKLRSHTQMGDFAGKQYLQSMQPQLPSFYMPDDRTLLVMTEIALRKTLAPVDAEATSPLLKRVGELPGGDDLYAVVDVVSLRPLIVPWLNFAVAQQRDKFPVEAKPFLELPNLISSIDLALNITNSSPTLLAVHASDAASADKLVSLYGLAIELQQKQMAAGAAKLLASDDPVERALGQYTERMSKSTGDAYQMERHGDDLILFEFSAADATAQNQIVLVGVIGVLVALLLPAVQAAREAARRNQSMNNIKQLLLSLHIHHDSRKAFPAVANFSPDGKPLLSWRVHILPYVEAGELYSQFKLDEPWDSEHNRQLIARMPAVFADPNLPTAAEGNTNYLAVVGKDCVFDGTAQGLPIRQITDGTSRTIVLVEANADRAVPWTKPDDWHFDPKNPAAGLGGLRPGGWLAGWADGHVSFVASGIDLEVLRGLFTRSGGEKADTP